MRRKMARPRGIFSLDGSTRDGRNIRDYPFMAGFAWRLRWDGFETSEGIYNFSSVAPIVEKLGALGQSLTHYITLWDPPYVASTPGVTTWTYEHPKKGTVTQAVPWDGYLQERHAIYLDALSSVCVGGTPYRYHSTLGHLVVGIPGIGFLRESSLFPALMPGYTRERLVDTVLTGLSDVLAAFPNTPVSLGLWKVTDSIATPPLWEALRSVVLATFPGRVGFFQENLAASKDMAGVVTGYPKTAYAVPLYLSRDDTHVHFQALQAWNNPFEDPAKTAGAVPADGLQWASDAYHSTSVDMYVADLDDIRYWPAFEAWNNQVRP